MTRPAPRLFLSRARFYDVGVVFGSDQECSYHEEPLDRTAYHLFAPLAVCSAMQEIGQFEGGG